MENLMTGWVGGGSLSHVQDHGDLDDSVARMGRGGEREKWLRERKGKVTEHEV